MTLTRIGTVPAEALGSIRGGRALLRQVHEAPVHLLSGEVLMQRIERVVDRKVTI